MVRGQSILRRSRNDRGIEQSDRIRQFGVDRSGGEGVVTRHQVGSRTPDTRFDRVTTLVPYGTVALMVMLLRDLTMPRPIPVPIRQTMFRLWKQGCGTRQIVASLGLPCSTVRRLLQSFRLRGRDGISPDDRYRSATFKAPSEMVQTAVQMRREHPTWGSGLIRVQWLLMAPGQPVPSERTLQRWFVRADLSPAPAGRPPRVDLDRATAPHETWQMDAKEHIQIQNYGEVSWLRLIDECSGAALWTAVLPQAHFEGASVDPTEGRNTSGLGVSEQAYDPTWRPQRGPFR